MVNMLSQIYLLVGLQVDQCTSMYWRKGERNDKLYVYLIVFIARVIYWNAQGYGWSIGDLAYLELGGHWHKSGLDSEEPWQGKWKKNVTVECIERVNKQLQNDTENDIFVRRTDTDDASGTGVTNSMHCLVFCYFPLLYLTQCVKIV